MAIKDFFLPILSLALKTQKCFKDFIKPQIDFTHPISKVPAVNQLDLLTTKAREHYQYCIVNILFQSLITDDKISLKQNSLKIIT